jgi:hypothetical protein
MGTNYYEVAQPACPHCGRDHDQLHIGKSSAGWCFSLHVIPAMNLNDWPDWESRLSDGRPIEDEYGKRITLAELREIVTDRGRDGRDWEQSPYGYPSWPEFHRRNHSQPGPKGLLRHQLSRWCVGHGAGTWDLLPGEFS